MSQTLAKEIIFTASSQLGKSVEIVDADWRDKYEMAVILRRNDKTVIQLNGVRDNRELYTIQTIDDSLD